MYQAPKQILVHCYYARRSIQYQNIHLYKLAC